MATAGALIGSQSLITSTFSIVRQSMRLNCFPPLKILHTGAVFFLIFFLKSCHLHSHAFACLSYINAPQSFKVLQTVFVALLTGLVENLLLLLLVVLQLITPTFFTMRVSAWLSKSGAAGSAHRYCIAAAAATLLLLLLLPCYCCMLLHCYCCMLLHSGCWPPSRHSAQVLLCYWCCCSFMMHESVLASKLFDADTE